AVRPRGPRALATAMGAPVETFTREIGRFNLLAGTGVDYDFHRGDSAYDRYYGDPTSVPNPNESPRVWWRLGIHGRMRNMAAPRKYPDELRERATRMAVQARRDPSTRSGTFRRVGEQLGINPETLRNWVVQAEVDEGYRPGTTTSESQRLIELEKEVRELRRANSILRS